MSANITVSYSQWHRRVFESGVGITEEGVARPEGEEAAVSSPSGAPGHRTVFFAVFEIFKMAPDVYLS